MRVSFISTFSVIRFPLGKNYPKITQCKCSFPFVRILEIFMQYAFALGSLWKLGRKLENVEKNKHKLMNWNETIFFLWLGWKIPKNSLAEFSTLSTAGNQKLYFLCRYWEHVECKTNRKTIKVQYGVTINQQQKIKIHTVFPRFINFPKD